MSVFYFACAGHCGTMLSDCDEDQEWLRHEASKGEWEDGTYCTACVAKIKSTRYGADPMNVLVVRKQHEADAGYLFETLTEVGRPELKALLRCIQHDFQVAVVYRADLAKFAQALEGKRPTAEQICEAMAQPALYFQTPREMFRDMVMALREEQAEYWELPPTWPDAQRKRERLEDQIRELDRAIHQKQALRDAKKAKLDAVKKIK